MSIEPTSTARPKSSAGCHPVGAVGASAQDDRAGDATDGSVSPAGTLVSLSIEQTEPLVGTATCARGSPVPFVGWLELLRTVSELVAAEGRRDDDRPAVARRVTE